MIEQIISAIDTELGFADNAFGLAELVTDEQGRKRPAYYLGNGKFKDISFPKKLFTSYWRITRDIRNEKDESCTACSKQRKRIYNLSYIVVKKRDDCDFEDDLFDLILISLDGLDSKLKKSLGVKKLEINAKGYSANREEISKREYTKDFTYRLEYLAMSIDFEIEITYDVKCLKNICYEVQ